MATKKREETKSKAAPKKAKPGGESEARRPVRRAAAGAKPGAPRLRTHATTRDAKAAPKRRTGAAGASIAAAVKAGRGAGPALHKAPLAAPKRTTKRSVPPGAAERAGSARPEPSNAARDLALALAAAGLESKAIGIEILDVTGKVDYADFLVVMTGRSDRHVYAIAMGLEEGVKKLNLAPLSVEGLTASTWVLIDFGDVVVHVFQEEARLLYDIEGLWISAGRVPVPHEPGAPGSQLPAGSSDPG
ncbi:MAG: ribosome silencing factor [Byssovorax sp.]